MAIPAEAVWEVRVGASDLYGGFFNPTRGGTDYSQRFTPIVTANASLNTNGTTTITNSYAVFTSDMIGNGMWIGGTINSWFEIVTYISTTQVTVDRVVAAGTNHDIRVGGAVATPGRASQFMVPGNKVWIRAGTYTGLSGTVNVADGRMSPPAGIVGGAQTVVEGYNTVRGDMVMGVTPPVTIKTTITAGANYIQFVNARSILRNIIIDNNRLSGSGPQNYGIQATNARLENVHVYRSETVGMTVTGSVLVGCVFSECRASSCWATNSSFINCIFQSTRGTSQAGLNVIGAGNIYLSRCKFFDMAGATAIGHGVAGTSSVIMDQCIIDQCTVGLVRGAAATGDQIWSINNSIFSRCTGSAAIASDVNSSGIIARNCAFWSNTADAQSNVDTPGKVSLTSNPFIDAASFNYRLTAPSVVQLRAAGFEVPGSWLPSLVFPPSIGSTFIPFNP